MLLLYRRFLSLFGHYDQNLFLKQECFFLSPPIDGGVFMNLFESTFCQILNYAVFVIRGYSCLEFIVVFSTLALFHII